MLQNGMWTLELKKWHSRGFQGCSFYFPYILYGALGNPKSTIYITKRATSLFLLTKGLKEGGLTEQKIFLTIPTLLKPNENRFNREWKFHCHRYEGLHTLRKFLSMSQNEDLTRKIMKNPKKVLSTGHLGIVRAKPKFFLGTTFLSILWNLQ